MGRASHKLVGSYIEIASKIRVEELRSIALVAAEATVPTGIYRTAKARIRPNGTIGLSGPLKFKIGTEKRSIMTFSVTFDEDTDGSEAWSEIESFTTKQDTFLGVPAGPKELVGWNWYLNFMQNFGRAVSHRDPNAQVEIVESRV